VGKHLGMFIDRIGNPDGSPISAQVIVNIPSNGREVKNEPGEEK
jgi:hypothetical protein